MAVFRDYASDSMQWAVKEASKCFQAPLDHTRHGPVEFNRPVEPIPEMVNTPTGNAYFDRMLKSDVGLAFMELSNSRNKEKIEFSPDVKHKSHSVLSSCVSVVVVKEDGSRSRHSLPLNTANSPSVAASEDAAIDDLTMRSSPSAVAAAIEGIIQQRAAQDVQTTGAVPGQSTEARQCETPSRVLQVENLPSMELKDGVDQEENDKEEQEELIGDILLGGPIEHMIFTPVPSRDCTALHSQQSIEQDSILNGQKFLTNMWSKPDVQADQPAAQPDLECDSKIPTDRAPISLHQPSKELQEYLVSPECTPETLRQLLPDLPVSPDAHCNLGAEAPLSEAAHLSEPKPFGEPCKLDTALERCSWEVGTVLEVFSASNNRWFPALVKNVLRTKTGKEMLTVQFWLSIDDAKEKSLCRESEMLASIGTKCGDQLPPGFEISASRSRPGMFVFLDATTGLKYDTLELIWAVHFKRWLEQPSAALTETINCLPSAVVTPSSTPVNLAADVEPAFGLMTRVVPEVLPETAERSSALPAAPMQQVSQAASGMFLEAGYDDFDDAWAPWMKWADKSSGRPIVADGVVAPARAAVAGPAEHFDTLAPCTAAVEEPDRPSSEVSEDGLDGPPDDEFIAKMPAPASQSPMRFNLASSMSTDISTSVT